MMPIQQALGTEGNRRWAISASPHRVCSPSFRNVPLSLSPLVRSSSQPGIQREEESGALVGVLALLPAGTSRQHLQASLLGS